MSAESWLVAGGVVLTVLVLAITVWGSLQAASKDDDTMGLD